MTYPFSTTQLNEAVDQAQALGDYVAKHSSQYFVISCNEDGDTRVDVLTRDELVRRITIFYYGDPIIYLDNIPDRDTANWPAPCIIIIRGTTVIPLRY